MIVLSCNNICKLYGITTVLQNITFNVQDGDRVGLVGINGAGKSTLFKILVGQLPFDSGNMYVAKDKTIGYLPQDMALDSSSTIMEEMLKVYQDLIDMEKEIRQLEAMISDEQYIRDEDYHGKLMDKYSNLLEEFGEKNGYGYKSFIRGVLSGLGFSENDMDKKINILSGGQKTRVALAKLLLIKPDILLLDEPTNHLDLDAVEWLEDFLKAYNGCVFIISHDRFFLDVITNRIFELSNCKLDEYNGNYSSYVKEREIRRENLLKQYTLQQKEIARQEAIIERFRSYNREKSIKQAESREKALDRIDRIEKPDRDPEAARIIFETRVRSGNDVLSIKNLSKSFGSRTLFSDINLEIKRGERVALIGPNGTGKTTIFRIIMGALNPDGGTVSIGRNVTIGYYDQEQSDLNEDKNIVDEIWDAYPDLTQTRLRTILGAFLFTGEEIFKPINLLSGGEKSRVAMIKLILSKSNLLLLDEPTNHLDIISKEALEKALSGYNGTIFTISHDRYFLNKVVDRIIYLSSEGCITEYPGNYSYYLEKKGRPTRFIEPVEKNTGITKTAAREEKKKLKEKALKEKQKKEALKNIEDNIASLEENIANLEKQLCREEIYSNPDKSQKVHNNIKETQSKLDELYKEWEDMI